ncbi:MAG: hypothetical protein NT028_11705, partial [candidate division Zixibacteria bacterium]|nr:hypothetical protein [candidate division Zixibacteria bacterium]
MSRVRSARLAILVVSLLLAATADSVALPLGQRHISYGDLVFDTISILREVDTLTFDGQAGDQVTLRIQPSVNPYFNALVEIRGPSLDTSQVDVYHYANQVSFVDLVLPDSGEYVVFVSESDGDQIAPYWLSLQCRQQLVSEALPIGYDTLVTDSISPYGDMDGFVFVGDAGDQVTLRIQPSVNPYFNALVEIRGPSLDTSQVDVYHYANQVS